MSEKPIVIARFEMPAEAQLACGRLQAEGISAHVVGLGGAATLGFLVSIGGQIELYVDAADAPRAQQILAACMPNERWRALLDDQQERAPSGFIESGADERLTNVRYENDDAPLWVCSLCGDAISVAETVCAACGTPREAQPTAPQESREKRSRPSGRRNAIKKDKGMATASSRERELDEDGWSPTHQGDLLASRAFRAALLSFIFPCLGVVAFALIWQLMFYSGELSPSGTRKLYCAIAINALAVFLLFCACAGGLHYR